MSGGSMNYLYSHVQDAAFSENTPLRRAFREHLNKVALALRAIEWNDSCDGDDREEEYITACLEEGAELKQLCKEATKLKYDLEALVIKAQYGEKK